MKSKFAILYVDDEESNLNIFKNTFRREYEIFVANSAAKGLEILSKEHVDLILTDQRMPEMDGVDFLKHALVRFPNLHRILITAYSDFDVIQQAINEAQIFQYIQKPWSEENLRHIIEQALEVYKVKQENEELSRLLEEKNKQLEKINKDLLELEHLKSGFLATISHEIRTPLNGLRGPLGMLKQEINAEDGKKLEVLFYILENSVDRLERFALSAERITWLKAQRYKLEIESLLSESIVSFAMTILEDKIAKKNISFEYDLDKSAIFFGDRELVNICVQEIIDNAIKFSYQSGIVGIKSYPQDDWVIIEVNDQGVGFPDKVLKRIFELFITSEECVNQNVGLDLALVKLIMDAHKGKIEILNNAERGATVRLFFKNGTNFLHLLN